MTVHSINWPSFAVFNADKNIQNQFEELCRQLFIHEFVSQNAKFMKNVATRSLNLT